MILKYHVANIETRFAEEWQKDIFEQQLFDLGFDTIDGSFAYLPSEVWNARRTEIEALCADTQGVTLVDIKACPDDNWNAVWEAEHPVPELPMGVKIIPHCAFGAGHHETTSMMIEALINRQSLITDTKPFRVLDHGTGTGVLAVFAKRLGAEYVLAIDIDEKSVENAKENAALNGVDIDVLQTDTLHLKPSSFDLILANIHRNILLNYMPYYADALRSGGDLWLSGFYETDCPALIQEAAKYGLEYINTLDRNEWRMIQLRLQ